MAKKNEIEILINATDNASKQFDNVSKKSLKVYLIVWRM